MPKRISAAERGPRPTPVRVVVVTLDSHLAGAVERAGASLKRDLPELQLSLHVAAEWNDDPEALERCHDDIAAGDIILVSMLFMEDHIRAVLPALRARRDDCDAMVACISAGEVIKLTRMGRFDMGGEAKGAMALLKRLRGARKEGSSGGAKQLAMLRRLPKLLRFIPGTAQDVRAYFLTLQYWLSGSEANVANMVRLLVDRYADGPRRAIRGRLAPKPPIEYPETGVYHPRLDGRIAATAAQLPRPAVTRGTVGVLVMRSYVLGGDTAHYDGVIEALERKGLAVVPAFASGLDARPAVDAFFVRDGKPIVDAVVSLTGFSLVGGPAYNDAAAAAEALRRLDVPYLSAQAVEFQTLEQWQGSDRGLLPVEATMMVAIPELDGAVGPIVYGGRSGAHPSAAPRAMALLPERTERLASRVDRLVELRRTARHDRRLAIVIFNFPPNSGATGTAAYLSVFQSLQHTLEALAADGYDVEVPESAQALQAMILEGNAQTYGADANVHARIPVDDHVRRETHLADIEAQWGPAPGRQQTDGASLFVLGIRLGKVFIGVQPAFGYEGDPMRLLFEKSFAPTHAFTAFYRYVNEDFGAHAVLHFGMHGALEFMPGKQVGLSAACWPDRLIGDLPNIYLYAANNPSEGTLAKRRSAATIVTYMTPPLAQAGLYRGLLDLKSSLDRWRTRAADADGERQDLAALIQAQAAAVELADAEPAWEGDLDARVARLVEAVLELEYTLIPHGLHVVGEPPNAAARTDLLVALAESTHGVDVEPRAVAALVDGASPERAAGPDADGSTLALFRELAATEKLLAEDHELPGLLHALDGGFTPPVPGGDLLRTPAVLPTGRNLHGFDPFRLPSAFAVADGERQAQRLLDRHAVEGHALPETVAMVLWGTDNLKSEGGPIAQALALFGARPRFDSYGRLAGAELVPLDELGRPRIDVVVTLSGIFRDLLPLQTRLLAEAAYLAASAPEPFERNYVAKHARTYAAANGVDLETAALRVFSNADGAYGSNVNYLVDSGTWQDEDELAETYTQRKSFAYGRDGKPAQNPALLKAVLSDVQLAYQNLESVELGVTTIDHYFDTLGGIGRAVRRARGEAIPVYIGDQTRSEGRVRTLGEQVALETRTRMLNPKWYEGMLEHGYEGVRQIEAAVTNTVGWSATTGAVAPWIYQQLTQTYVLDREMRERLMALNPKASARVASRLLEAHERSYWAPDEAMLEALREAGDELEDRLEGITEEVAA